VFNLGKLGILAAMISSEQTPAENRQILAMIRACDPLLRLVYVTPESIAQRSAVMSALQVAYRQKHLARFGISFFA